MEISERFIFHIWDAQHIKTNLQTASGKAIQIIYPGRWNSASGADFKDAVIKLDEEIIRGDVEIHLKTYDWLAHKHQEDRNFNTVILHVVYLNKGNHKFTINQAGDLIEILEIGDFLDQSINKLLRKYEGINLSIQNDFCEYFAGRSSDITAKLMEKNGLARLERKLKRFAAEMIFSDFDQIAYQGIMEALGYNKNKFQMLQLARKINFSFIKKCRQQGMQKEELISIFIFSNSLSEHIPSSFPAEIKNKWLHLYTKQEYFTEKLDIDWKLFRIRPVNHPVIRIVQVIDLIWETSSSSLFKKIVALFSYTEDAIDLKDFYKRLKKFFHNPNNILPENYLMGQTRIDTLTINIIIPLVLLYARKMSYPNLADTIIDIYKNYHALPLNFIEKHMNRFMQTSQVRLIRKKAMYQQGLLNLYFDYCKDHNCQICKSQLETDLTNM